MWPWLGTSSVHLTDSLFWVLGVSGSWCLLYGPSKSGDRTKGGPVLPRPLTTRLVDARRDATDAGLSRDGFPLKTGDPRPLTVACSSRTSVSQAQSWTRNSI